MRSLSFFVSLLPLAACGDVVVTDRDAVEPVADEDVEAVVIDERAIVQTVAFDDVSGCEVSGVSFFGFAAGASGGVFAVGGANGALLQRYEGRGCALTPAGAPIAGDLIDIDDNGAVWVRASNAPTHEEGVIDTRGEDSYGDLVVRVGADDAVTEIARAGRGIWQTAVSAEGDAFMATSCGSINGFSRVNDDGSFAPLALSTPNGEWAAGVFTADDTFWSPGQSSCTDRLDGALDDVCGPHLVRTDSEGSVELGSTVLDFGAGFEQGVLSRCGHDVCGVFASAVVVWDRDGAIARVVAAEAILPGAFIVGVSGNSDGLYIRVVEPRAMQRLFFVPN